MEKLGELCEWGISWGPGRVGVGVLWGWGDLTARHRWKGANDPPDRERGAHLPPVCAGCEARCPCKSEGALDGRSVGEVSSRDHRCGLSRHPTARLGGCAARKGIKRPTRSSMYSVRCRMHWKRWERKALWPRAQGVGKHRHPGKSNPVTQALRGKALGA